MENGVVSGRMSRKRGRGIGMENGVVSGRMSGKRGRGTWNGEWCGVWANE